MSDATEWVSDESTPPRYGRYELVRVLGSGAMGQVFAARDLELGREVALKVMHPQRGPAGDDFRARFAVEARAAARLVHPAVVQVFDIGCERDEPFLVLELMRGGTLEDWLSSGPMRPEEAQSLGIQIGAALAAAHALGIVHRDVKPANILRGDEGWKLSDFGIAHVPGTELTATGVFLGTPAYAAPEALRAGRSTPACDVYSLGATLYTAIAGETPFGADSRAVTGQRAVPIEMRAAGVPDGLAAAIGAALDAEPARRPTAAQFVEMIGWRGVPVVAVAPPARATPSRKLWVALGAAVLGAVILAAMAADRPSAHSSAMTAPSAQLGAVDPSPRRRDPELEATWQDALRDLREGDTYDAMEKLADILRQDPTDPEALALYDQLRAYEATADRGKRKYKKAK